MTKPDQVWIVDDDRSIRWVLEKALQKAGIQTRSFSAANSLLEALALDQPEAVLTDIRMPGMDGLALLERLQARYPDLPVIVMTAHSDLESAVSAFHGGAFEYLPKPFDVDEAVDRVQRACVQARSSRSELEPLAVPEATPEIIGAAPAMQEVFRAIAYYRLDQWRVGNRKGTGCESPS